MYDLIIIGSGPAGLGAAIYGARAGLEFLVLEQNAVSGGQILTTYEVENYPGFPGIDGAELAARFRDHGAKLGVSFMHETVLEIIELEDHKQVRTAAHVFETKCVLLATGATYAKLGVPGEEELKGKGVSYCATCDGAFFRDKKVAVVGGGNAALENAVYLAGLCRKVYLIHRRDRFRGEEVLQEKVKALSGKNVEILLESEVESIEGDQCVKRLKIKSRQNETQKYMDVDGIFVAVGMKPDSELVRDLVSCDEKGYVIAGEDGVTDHPGIFVAGDVRTKKCRQIVTAVSDGANACASILDYCEKD